MSRSRTLQVLSLGVFLLAGSARPQALPQADGAAPFLRPTADITLSGVLTVSRFEVPRDVTVWLSDDLTLRSTGPIVIEGAIAAWSDTRTATGRRGFSLELISAERITVNGVLAVGTGKHGVASGIAGGHGGNLTLQAPLIISAGNLLGGAGGDGGPNADGGKGGDVLASGALISTSGAAVRVIGGPGGAGGSGSQGSSGAPGGTGGDGGDGTVGVPGNDGLDIILETPAPDGLPGAPCTPGTPGGVGSVAEGGSGGMGGPGGTATTAGGNGGLGGIGGKGGAAQGSGGGRGGQAGGCCFAPSTGPNGANGGAGGPALGGTGGKGGSGGIGSGTGMGGDGGMGGGGGDATGGSGGNGGRGANGFFAGAGGTAGTLGSGNAGSGGSGGSAGNGGLGSGQPGFPGVSGSGVDGIAGFNGASGTLCHPLVSWTDTGFGLAGTAGLVPKLSGTGTLAPLTVNTLQLTDGSPIATAGLFAGFSPLLFPFKGGYLVPAPDLLVTLATGGFGGLSLPFFLPASMPSGFVFHLQFWILDPDGPAGFSASNGLRARTP